jgi:hypothetical protein
MAVEARAAPENAEAPAEPTPPLRLSLSAGVGASYAGLGAHLEARWGHFGGFLGTGSPLTADLSFPVVAGVRWLGGDGQGPMLALHTLLLVYRGSSQARETVFSAALGAGYRFRLRDAFLDVSAGPALTHDSYQPAPGSFVAPFARWEAGLRFAHDRALLPLDATVALGMEL